MRRLPALILLAFLTACGPRLYVAPTGNPADLTRITIRNLSALELGPRFYENPLTCAYTLLLSQPPQAVAPGRSQSLVVVRGKPVTIGSFYSRYWGGGTRYCGVNATFVAEEDSYTAVFDADDKLEHGCRVQVRIGQSSEGKALAPPKLVVRGYSQAIVEATGWCRGLTEAERAGLGLLLVQDERPQAPSPK